MRTLKLQEIEIKRIDSKNYIHGMLPALSNEDATRENRILKKQGKDLIVEVYAKQNLKI